MDKYYGGPMDSINGLRFDGASVSNQTIIEFLKVEETSLDQYNFVDLPQLLPDQCYNQNQNGVVRSSTEKESQEVDVVLKYISEMLMEEDMGEKNCMFQESSSIKAAEKPFYEILGEKYPPSPNDYPLGQNIECSCSNYNSFHTSGSNPVDSNWLLDLAEYNSSQFQSFPADYSFQFTCQSSNCINYVGDGVLDTSLSRNNVQDFYSKQEPDCHFRKGVEEIGWRGRKNLHRVDIDFEEGRSNKRSAVFTDEPLLSETFDLVLLCNREKEVNVVSTLQETLRTEASKNGQQNGGKSRNRKKDVVDLRALLIHCAQAVAADDSREANELLKQIRQHSSPFGDGNQRLAHCFANGLEARLAGTGSLIYSALLNKRTSAADILEAYHLFLVACPYRKSSIFFSNSTINILSENATSLHIIDLGINYGFQWPCFIQSLAARPGGPPKLRITGVDLPQPGFRPTERIEETGLRLASYAVQFSVPFEYRAIAQKWETIQIEDLKIDPDEVLFVNCLYRTTNMLDESAVLECPRNTVLNLIRKMNPTAFIQGVANGAYNAPFFLTRFREALFNYSSIFDMLEKNIPRGNPERILLEDRFGREAINVVACEGTERIERPETYKQWQVRNMRAGLELLPLQSEYVKRARDWVKSSYHKDFFIDHDSQWMLQGWKGRIIYAISAWRAAHNS